MIKLNLRGHYTMCGGYNYSGSAEFEGKTVKEVLEEIKEFSRKSAIEDIAAEDIGEGFGNSEVTSLGCWRIEINNIVYLSNWVDDIDEIKYNHEYDNEEVDYIAVSGGWYCYYDFYIYTKGFKGSR